MDIGLLHNKRITNIGDDIQAYAVARLLPRVDRMVDRENMHTDAHFNNKPTATVMAAWFMGKKWEWPPADCLRPLFTSFHYTDFEAYPLRYLRSSYEYITGPGADYLRSWGPIGCRDLFTMEQLQARGIEAYFSGCVTLTLPQQPTTADAKKYVCAVDVTAPVEKKIRQIYEGSGLEVRKMTHLTTPSDDSKFSDRSKAVEALLTTYQNAYCVITRRLHVALPCLAMGTPVILVNNNMHPSRFRPYSDWIPHMTPEEFLERDVADMLLNPKPNSEAHLPYREALIKQIREFGEKAAAAEDIQPRSPIPYTELDYLRWHHDVMEENLLRWYKESKDLVHQIDELKANNAQLKKKLKSANIKVKKYKVFSEAYQQETEEAARLQMADAFAENFRVTPPVEKAPEKVEEKQGFTAWLKQLFR